MTLHIIGAGMAGLLAANMLRHHRPVVLEAQASLPNNHSAVLRFRSQAVGDVLGIEFRKVKMIKSWLPWRNPVADGLAYASKNGGVYRSDRSIVTSSMEVQDRFIAPANLIERMADGVQIDFSYPFAFDPRHAKVISTIPMPTLMRALKYPGAAEVSFSSVTGLNVRALVEGCDAHVSLMVPDPDIAFSRVSITGDEMIVEIPRFNSEHHAKVFLDAIAQENAAQAAYVLGIEPDRVHSVSARVQTYAKINPIDESQRRDFIYWASTIQGRAFSLGRFATWRPGLLLDDLIHDVRLIDGWLRSASSGYEQEHHEGEKRSRA